MMKYTEQTGLISGDENMNGDNRNNDFGNAGEIEGSVMKIQCLSVMLVIVSIFLRA